MEGRKLRVYITVTEEPLVVNRFIEEIVKAKSSQIIGIGATRGNRAIPRITRSGTASAKKRSALAIRARNVISLLLMFGVVDSMRNGCRALYFHLSKAVNRVVPLLPTRTIQQIASSYEIPYQEFSSVNDECLLQLLHGLKPDIVINQARGILRKRFLDAAEIGVLNRHNALLPKNRGRFSPFWTLYKQEEYAGVSIHFVTEELDAGEIVVQKRFRITQNETVSSVVKKCYSIAPAAMIEAIDILESGEYELLPNSDEEATYNTNPTLDEVIELLKRRWRIRRTAVTVGR